MRIITAIDTLCFNEPTVFLAGGITNCPEWQDKIIEILKKTNKGIAFNPRRKHFPINDPNASKEQIEWEFNALNRADVFSIWFSSGESVQPICMYELGRHLALRLSRNELDRVVIGVEKGYLRTQDVLIQTEFVSRDLVKNISTNLQDHAMNIIKAMRL